MSGLFENFPYTNFHEVNLGWVIKTVYDMGNSYRYPMGYPVYMNDGYSRHSDKEQMKKELKEMMESSSDDQMKKSIMEILSRL